MLRPTVTEDQERVLRLIKVLRNITLAVQIAPFAYSSFYIVSCLMAFAEKTQVQYAFDLLFYVSPVFVLSHLIYSRILHLCAWHKTACALPLIPMTISLLDYYVIDMSEFHSVLFNCVLLIMVALLLVAAYNVFLKPKSKRNA